MNAVIYRPYKRQDFKAVSSIINIIWKHESYYSPKTAVRLSEAYLRLCLTEQTFTQVALADGKPIGIIMGNHIRRHRCPLVLRLQAGWSVLVLSMTAEGRRSWRFLEEIDRIYAALLSGQPQEYRGRTVFFSQFIRIITDRGLEGNCSVIFVYIWKERIYSIFMCLLTQAVTMDFTKT